MQLAEKQATSHADHVYSLAEQKAAQYYESLYAQVMGNDFVPTLTRDFHIWKQHHIHRYAWLTKLGFTSRKREPDSRDYHRYIRWMDRAGKLDDYLSRSVSYMYMRDLGRAMDSPDTQARIKRMTASIRNHVLQSAQSGHGGQSEDISSEGLYRWAQKEAVETAAIWVLDKLKAVAAHMPDGLNAEQAQRKLIKIIIGVVLHVLEDMDDRTAPEERARRLDEAIRLGYSYGLTYPFIDDLLDSQVLTPHEQDRYSRMIHATLLDGAVPELGEWPGHNRELIHFIHRELREAFTYMKNHQRPETYAAFFEQSYVLFRSQEADRDKTLTYAHYKNEDLYIPIILKSAASRLIVRAVIGAAEDEGFERRTFYYGIYNQLADDFADLFDDRRDGAVTPYTYYLQYREQRPDLINPFALYWTVISHLIHDVYQGDAQAREVILDRAINGLKRCKARLGAERYNEIMSILATGDAKFDRLIQQMVDRASDVDFFDKLLRDQMVTSLRNDRQEREHFHTTIQQVREQINRTLQIEKPGDLTQMKAPLIDAANYSLAGDGKRLRPILTWVMGVEVYGLAPSAIVPLLRSLEYMHTASLIFDDLPSQDNADTRRGRPTLHQVHDVATAELTGLFLIQRATQEQASLTGFDPNAVLALMRYSSQKVEELCIGQAMDLHAKGQPLTLDELNTICFYKTGIAFEAALVMPAILAQANESEIEALKKFAYHAGIAFQIKDDLLDLEGDLHVLGKPIGQDIENNCSTFVSVLGRDDAMKAMWEHYCSAMESLKGMPRQTSFLKHLMDYIIYRNR